MNETILKSSNKTETNDDVLRLADAGGDYDEENAVCYLQILLADHIEQFGRSRMFEDMDRWGYTFRLGSAQTWFEGDADDALAWLSQKNLINKQQEPNWTLRKD
jgi:hypothetical protein